MFHLFQNNLDVIFVMNMAVLVKTVLQIKYLILKEVLKIILENQIEKLIMNVVIKHLQEKDLIDIEMKIIPPNDL
jgi:hypothetical protein